MGKTYKEGKNKHERSESKAYERMEQKSRTEAEYKKGSKSANRGYKGKY